MIRSNGNQPISIVEAVASKNIASKGAKASLSLFDPKVKTKDVAIFCKQMSTMIGARYAAFEFFGCNGNSG